MNKERILIDEALEIVHNGAKAYDPYTCPHKHGEIFLAEILEHIMKVRPSIFEDVLIEFNQLKNEK